MICVIIFTINLGLQCFWETQPWSHDENAPLGTFLQDVKYVVSCTFRDMFDVKCLLSGAKRVFTQMNVHMVCFM